MVLDRMGVPASVLRGKDKKYIKVYHLYKARLTQEIMRALNYSFWTRAKGQKDPVAGKWKPLSGNTINYKATLSPLDTTGIIRDWYERVNYEDSQGAAVDMSNVKRSFTTGQLPPEERDAFNALVKKFVQEDKSDKPGKLVKAKKKAWQLYQDRIFASRINIRTGRLVAATAPGTVANNRYYPPVDQIARLTYGSTYISLKRVEYADQVDMQREIIPKDISVWRAEAHATIISEVAGLYFTLKQMYEQNKPIARLQKKKKKKPNVPF